MYRKRIAAVLLLAVVAGCGNEHEDRSATVLPPASLPGVYSGIFPCDGCAGIPTTLWLRPDGRFFFRQRYPADATSTVDDVYSLGRWNLSTGNDAVELRGESEFSATMRLSGMTRIFGDDVSFAECLTGFEAPVSKSSDFPRFWHQVRSVGRSREPVYVELEGAFTWVRADAAC